MKQEYLFISRDGTYHTDMRDVNQLNSEKFEREFPMRLEIDKKNPYLNDVCKSILNEEKAITATSLSIEASRLKRLCTLLNGSKEELRNLSEQAYQMKQQSNDMLEGVPLNVYSKFNF